MSYCSSCSTGDPQANQRSATCYRSPSCNLFSPNWKYDPHLKDLCRKFGQFAPEACREVVDPCQPRHQSLQSLDHFSLPPMYRKGGYAPAFKCRSMDSVNAGRPCAPPLAGMDRCPGIPQLPGCLHPKPNPYGDAVCGVCVGPEELARRTCDFRNQAQGDTEEEDDGLPFVIYPLWTEGDGAAVAPKKKRHSAGVGAARCLHPSNFRSLESVSKFEYPDFYKMKSPEELALYQSKLAVDNHRPPVCIPRTGPNDQLDLSQPIFINAKMLRNRPRGRATGDRSVSVCVPGPITIG